MQNYISHFPQFSVHADSGVVDAVMKMWPPPAAPKDGALEKDAGPRGSGRVVGQTLSSSGSSSDPKLPPRSIRPADQPGLQRVLSQPGQPNPAPVTASTPPAPGYTLFILV